MEKQQIEKKRVNMFIPRNMVDELDILADELGANRTALINMVLRQYLDQREVVKMSKMIDAYDKNSLENK